MEWKKSDYRNRRPELVKYRPDMIAFVDGFNDCFAFDEFRDYAYRERAHLYMAEPTRTGGVLFDLTDPFGG
jgi:hypothetical protein